MPSFGKRSKERLETCHEDLQTICNEVIKYFDFSITEGHRTLEKQKQYYAEGKSKLDGVYRLSNHQYTPSKAVDIYPYPIDFSNALKAKARFYMLAGYMFGISEELFNEGKITHKLRWGGDWDSDKSFEDQSFDDLPHFELIKH